MSKQSFIKKAIMTVTTLAMLAGCAPAATTTTAGTTGSGTTAAGTTAASAVKNDWDKIKERGYIIVGLDDTFVPMGFKDEAGKLVGFDIDMAKEAMKRMGIEVRFQSIDWILKETELNSGKIDLIWNGYTISDARKEMVNFSEPYMDGRHVLVVPNNSTIKAAADMAGKTIATQNASTGLDILNNTGVSPTLKGSAPILYDSFNDAFMDVISGRIDGLVGDEIMVQYVLKQKNIIDQYRVIEIPGDVYQNGIGVRKTDTELLKKLDETINSMKEDGTAAKISETWFGTNIVK